ncbi:MAG: response regulator transcription factor [Devosiaceae bacterium]|nr:response regulator transcription factor [Devosiaceae bacterium]
MISILLLEDDQSLGATLCQRLGSADYNVTWVQDIASAQSALGENEFDLLVLDVGLPDGSGFDFAKGLLGQFSTPFIFLTAQSSAQERLKGYELGASEFIPKPFVFKELLLRIQHIFKDHQRPLQTIECANRTINLDTMSVSDSDGKITYLSNRDYKLLSMLIERAPRPLSRDEILDELCGQDQFPSNRTIDNSIVRLRQILGETGGKFIRSIRSVGYQWVPIEKDKQ